jgi:SAM-dependent methyltransferase
MVALPLLVHPLEREWKVVLVRVLRSLGSSIDDVSRLGARVAELSRAYNEGAAEGKKTKLPLDARIAFSFPRDVPKGAAAVRELIREGTLAAPPDRPLRILDLGAGLGAMTWGILRALGTTHAEAMLVDEDPDVLKAATAIARERAASGLAITTRVGTVAQYTDAKADIAVLGQVLSELDPRADAEARLATHAALVLRVLAHADTVVIVEPALRDRTRHLHALRDRVVAAGAHVHAPCLHSKACPALAVEGDWCHEDLAAIDLPDWVTPIARAAGLRWQGLTFSYLVLRKDPPARMPANGIRFRVTSDLLRSKGKVELFACCESGDRPRIRRLEREGAELDDLERGDVVTIRSASAPAPPIDERGRIAKQVSIDVGKQGH